MADSKRTAPRERLPIKVIMPKQGMERKVPGGGAPPTPFRTVNAEYRKRLSTQVAAIRQAITPQLKQAGAAPVRVKLIAKAAAKSHRPDHLFSQQSCPIVGAGKLGELFVKATPAGLTRLNELIETNESDRITKELSCIETIEAVTPTFRRNGAGRVLCATAVGSTSFTAVKSGTHAFALAEQLKNQITQTLTDRKGPLHSFWAAPNGFAFYLGQVSRQIGLCRLYEFDAFHRDYSASMDISPTLRLDSTN